MTEYSLHLLTNRASSFCQCNIPKNSDINNSKQLTCDCGENATDSLEWSWDTITAHPETHISGKNVVFHPVYSQGTSIIRGDKILKKNMHHYWEIKIITCLSGTDIMLGIGTEKVDLVSHQYRFASVLGLDDQSWGYSYRGLVQNGGRLKYYGKKFSQGSIIGIHVDLFRGVIEFYLNRRPLGVAYTNISCDDDTNLYPMACSTSAKSSIKLINSSSFEESLQFNCMRHITKYPSLLNELNKMPGLKKYTKNYWFLHAPEKYKFFNESTRNNDNEDQENLELEDEAILCGIKKKNENFATAQLSTTSSEFFPVCMKISPLESSLRGAYDPNGMHKVKHAKLDYSCESSDEDEIGFFPFFCDH